MAVLKRVIEPLKDRKFGLRDMMSSRRDGPSDDRTQIQHNI